MRVSNSGALHRFSGIFRLCLCLALVGITILGVDASTAATSVAGSPPEIRAFSADPMMLPDGSQAIYKFEVSGATDVQVTEAGALIKEINSPPGTTLHGNARGRTTYEIRTGNINTFDTVLIAKNASGVQNKTLTLSFVTKLPPGTSSLAPSDNKSGARTPKWGDQTSAATSLASSSITTGNAPQFTKCTGDCNYCLRPDDAASRGFTQKCSEQPCYYSPDNQQQWYCYSKPATVWCCKDGNVAEVTRDRCAQAGGSAFATQAEAQQACQGWCCKDGKVGQTTQTQCAQLGGYWSATQVDAINNCRQLTMGYCCRGGQIGATTQGQCAQLGGDWYATQAQAVQACQPSTCWCCTGGKIYQTTPAACSRAGGACYSSESQAAAACRSLTPLVPNIR